METEFLITCALQLTLSAVVCGIIGYEREMHGRPAGLRTHILVGVGATLFTLASVGISHGAGQDPGRIAAQVVSGVGFLCAGTILQQGNIVRGLTTAASLWAAAGVGLAIGAGGSTLFVGLIAAAVILLTLSIVRQLESVLDRSRGEREMYVAVKKPEGMMRKIVHALDEIGVTLRHINYTTSFGPSGHGFMATLSKEGGVDVDVVIQHLTSLPEVIIVEFP